eukprot:CAMPEP_0201141562 /NCGR_PEP_ID=MMETSP0851-20130426/3209_1 /ASSEMBLY_ACC=CAM_ASM_000631 /TAXON_ID=183588 /ORGANISM="Pseudo-nitzschia fraudulenta, Strain WWA7" /LENGTH=141 /DNA_ID=CAMNT_0047414775 /DNA_START=80 /DNA_END=502 /DNA_ORIENTATION=+
MQLLQCRWSPEWLQMSKNQPMEYGTLVTKSKHRFKERTNLITKLKYVDPRGGYGMYPIPDEKKNQRYITEIGPGTKRLVIHRRYVSEDNLKVVVECTLLKRDGLPCPVNTSVLIEMIAVEQYIIRSKSNIIINQLEQVENN